VKYYSRGWQMEQVLTSTRGRHGGVVPNVRYEAGSQAGSRCHELDDSVGVSAADKLLLRLEQLD
jgi:hypothetical protein